MNKRLIMSLMIILCVFSGSLYPMEEPEIDQPGDDIVHLVEIDVYRHIVQSTFADAQIYVSGLDTTDDENRQIVQYAQGILRVFNDAYTNYTRELANASVDFSVDEIEYRSIVEPNAIIIEQVIKMKTHGFEVAKVFIDGLGVDYITAERQSLLHLSARAGNEQLVAWLLQELSEKFIGDPVGMSAFVTLLDRQRKTAIDYAHALSVDNGIVQMLSQYGAIITHRAPFRRAPSVASAALAARQREERYRIIMPELHHDNDADRALLR